MFHCLLCHQPARAATDLCPACFGELPWIAHACRTCAEPLADTREELCRRCQQDLPAVDHCLAPLAYRFPLDQLILAMKQQPRPELVTSFTRWLAPPFSAQPQPDLLLPVPLHPAKQRQRGFNQAGLMAQQLGRALRIPVHHTLLEKPRMTDEQKTLSREQRQRNLARAFKLDRVGLIRLQPRPRHIVLVDDVVTTGATTSTLAALLKKSGVRRVDVWALAKTPLHTG
ncbi:MAG: ComF family protein [Gammaproteobacteria bacterium]|nr:ComF family protein [Gammaproteobacteria bacterium]